MRACVMSGNTELLEKLKANLFGALSPQINVDGLKKVSSKEEFFAEDNTIFFSDDYDLLKELNGCDFVSHIVVVQDESKLLDTKGENPGYFFNEARQTKPGEFLCDTYIPYDPARPTTAAAANIVSLRPP